MVFASYTFHLNTISIVAVKWSLDRKSCHKFAIPRQQIYIQGFEVPQECFQTACFFTKCYQNAWPAWLTLFMKCLNKTSQCTSSHFYKMNHQHLLPIKIGHLELLFFNAEPTSCKMGFDKGSPFHKGTRMRYHILNVQKWSKNPPITWVVSPKLRCVQKSTSLSLPRSSEVVCKSRHGCIYNASVLAVRQTVHCNRVILNSSLWKILLKTTAFWVLVIQSRKCVESQSLKTKNWWKSKLDIFTMYTYIGRSYSYWYISYIYTYIYILYTASKLCQKERVLWLPACDWDGLEEGS